ncbi:MAG: hypothetical protein EXR72_01260 [Myxococcales bacterium]|nr:hypothetical protein [Myxococcales bacterium]
MLVRPTKALLLCPLLLLAGSCAPKIVYSDADVPKMAELDDVMWAQAQVMDPQFKKIGRATYTDEDYAAFIAAGARLKLTTARAKETFSKGPEFNAFADQLAANAGELADAATAKDAVKSSAALASAKATCKACHAKFK